MDDDILARARFYAGSDFDKPRSITRKVFCEYGCETWALPDFLSAIEGAVAKIPEDRRADAVVELEGGYDESTSLKITFTDIETDEEVADRVRRSVTYALEAQARERAEFERLKAKYEKEQGTNAQP